jgi:hypothetical protein
MQAWLISRRLDSEPLNIWEKKYSVFRVICGLKKRDRTVNENMLEKRSEILIYQTEDGRTRIDVRLEDEAVWLTQTAMAELYQTTKQNISLHLKNLYSEGELVEKRVVKDYLTTATDRKRYQTNHYNLEAIIAVGYRVRSHRGTQFRIWVTQRLREYIVKGFTLDDERLKQAGGGNYFDELLARIRDIRASEKVFWRKVLDIYASSIDYDPAIDLSREFFSIVQNKMHWAAHGHTAAEIVADRADASQPNMGLTSWSGAKPTKEDAQIAKNYLDHEELDTLNRIVTMYLDFAELQALNRKPMYMRDWISKLDDFLKISDRNVLIHAGQVSHDDAIQKAHAEYAKYRKPKLEEPSLVERHFREAIEEAKKIEAERKPQRK